MKVLFVNVSQPRPINIGGREVKLDALPPSWRDDVAAVLPK